MQPLEKVRLIGLGLLVYAIFTWLSGTLHEALMPGLVGLWLMQIATEALESERAKDPIVVNESER
jgi:hypothetical protein